MEVKRAGGADDANRAARVHGGRGGPIARRGPERRGVDGRIGVLVLAACLGLLVPATGADAQTSGGPDAGEQAAQEDTRTITLITGTSSVVDHPATLERVSIADPSIADAVVVSAREVVVNAKAPGRTTLLLWDEAGGRRMYTVRVTADAASLQSQINRLFADAEIEVSATGNTLVLSGTVTDPGVEERASTLARALAGDVRLVNQIRVPERGQILLRVRFAEINRSALNELGTELFTVEDENVTGAAGTGQVLAPPETENAGEVLLETTQQPVNFFLFHRPSRVQGFFRALQSRGLMRSLAEPNLMAVPGDTASFLAGGEFPFPVLQGGGGSNAVTIQFKEFGIRLNFVPSFTNAGDIRLRVAPEVSQLDFSNALEVSGFRIPALLTRRASTTIELADGQTFAIAGLIDNSLTKNVNKVPILGDIPILGALFRSEDIRQNRTELLVLVTPHIMRPTDDAPDLPTGEPENWDWVDDLRGPPPGDETGSREAEDGPGGEDGPPDEDGEADQASDTSGDDPPSDDSQAENDDGGSP